MDPMTKPWKQYKIDVFASWMNVYVRSFALCKIDERKEAAKDAMNSYKTAQVVLSYFNSGYRGNIYGSNTFYKIGVGTKLLSVLLQDSEIISRLVAWLNRHVKKQLLSWTHWVKKAWDLVPLRGTFA